MSLDHSQWPSKTTLKKKNPFKKWRNLAWNPKMCRRYNTRLSALTLSPCCLSPTTATHLNTWLWDHVAATLSSHSTQLQTPLCDGSFISLQRGTFPYFTRSDINCAGDGKKKKRKKKRTFAETHGSVCRYIVQPLTFSMSGTCAHKLFL